MNNGVLAWPMGRLIDLKSFVNYTVPNSFLAPIQEGTLVYIPAAT